MPAYTEPRKTGKVVNSSNIHKKKSVAAFLCRCEKVYTDIEMSLILKPLIASVLNEEFFQIPRDDCTVSIGRGGGNDLKIDHISVSGSHAILECIGHNGVEVVDCDSSNGTFVNGLKVTRHPIKPGDHLRFASAEFKVLSKESPVESDEEEVPEKSPVEKLSEEIEQWKTQNESLQSDLDSSRARESETEEQLKDSGDQIAQLQSQLVSKDSEIEELRNAHAARLKEQASSHQAEIEQLKSELSSKEAVISQLSEENQSKTEEIRNLVREAESASEREVRLNAEITRWRSEVMERDRSLAALHYEVSQRDGWLSQKTATISAFDAQVAELSAEVDSLGRNLFNTEEALQERTTVLAEKKEKIESIRLRLRRFTEGILSDWEWWLESAAEVPSEASENDDEIDGILSTLESARVKIQSHLDQLEPVWKRFGAGAQRELEEVCENLRREQSELSDSVISRQKELAEMNSGLDDLRREMDKEVRRAQGLSRRGVEVEIPERFESMVIAKDSEEEIFRSLIQRIEFFDRLLEGYKRNKKLKEVVYELDEFRLRLVAILEANGVHPFEVSPGTDLTLKHRKQVKILARKGWGTRDFAEVQFKPGKVDSVVRCGYQIGSGETATILRKVEVLIQEAAG